MSRSGLVLSLVLVLLAPVAVGGEEAVDWEVVNRIRDEGFHRSQVMETLEHLTDVIGPRLTGSPGARTSSEWTRAKMEEWGLANAHLEEFGPFGRGWSFSRASVHMLRPRAMPLAALPVAWTPGTKRPVKGEAMRFEVESEEDFEEYRGKLKGKILFTSEPREIGTADEPDFVRYAPEELAKMTEFVIPGERSRWRKRAWKRWRLRKALNEFLVEEKAAAVVRISSRDAGILRVTGGGSREPDENPGVPAVAMAAESYNWIVRQLDDEQTVELEIDVRARFHDDDLMSYNTIAELPGTDLADELVIVGAHLDSWHAGTGSNDNAAGCVVAMEAARILKAIGVAPRRTIRVGLWMGEEQGLLGARAHVDRHFATRPESDDPDEQDLPAWMRTPGWPIETKPGHEKFSAYFNLDNGSGKIRGIYTQENAAVRPIFEAWLEPFHDLGATTVTNRNTGGTDHLAFDAVGLPGFQFIQDELDYSSRTHHSNLDVFDHAQEDDLKQASVVMASFLYHAAMRDDRLPRKPMPQKPPEKEEEDDEPAGD